MPYTLLQLVDQCAGELGLAVPSSVVGNSTQEVVQWLYLANGLGRDLSREHDWQRLTKEYRFPMVYYTYTGTTADGSTSVTGMSSIVGLDATFMVTGTGIQQDTYVSSASGSTVVLSLAATASGSVTLTFSQTKYAFPGDYDRLIDRTDWDKSKHWEMLGPETGQQWQWLKSGFISTGPRIRFRPLGGYFQVWPAQGTADLLGFEYVSNQWVLSTAATYNTPDKSAFSADTDVSIYPDSLMVLGLKSKYFQSKGWADPYGAQYEKQKAIAESNEAGSPTLSMAPRLSDVLITWDNIPDASFPG